MRRSGRLVLALGVAALLLVFAGGAAVQIYTDALWYGSLGYGSVYLSRLWIVVSVRAALSLLGAAIVLANLWVVGRQLGPVHLRRRYGNLEIAEQVPRKYLHVGMVAVACLAGWWLSGVEFGGDRALGVAAWLRQIPWGVRDPLLGRDL